MSDKCYSEFSKCMSQCQTHDQPECELGRKCRIIMRECMNSTLHDFALQRYEMAVQNGVSHETAWSALPESLILRR
jgi:hypothetical protein